MDICVHRHLCQHTIRSQHDPTCARHPPHTHTHSHPPGTRSHPPPGAASARSHCTAPAPAQQQPGGPPPSQSTCRQYSTGSTRQAVQGRQYQPGSSKQAVQSRQYKAGSTRARGFRIEVLAVGISCTCNTCSSNNNKAAPATEHCLCNGLNPPKRTLNLRSSPGPAGCSLVDGAEDDGHHRHGCGCQHALIMRQRH
jgi:hypothetical protein